MVWKLYQKYYIKNYKIDENWQKIKISIYPYFSHERFTLSLWNTSSFVSNSDIIDALKKRNIFENINVTFDKSIYVLCD